MLWNEMIAYTQHELPTAQLCRLDAGARALSVAAGQRHGAVFTYLLEHGAPMYRFQRVLKELVQYSHFSAERREAYGNMYEQT